MKKPLSVTAIQEAILAIQDEIINPRRLVIMTQVGRLKFNEGFVAVGAKTKVWGVFNNEIYLGQISFRPQWRRYVFMPNANTLFDRECLTEISGFLDIETAKWRNGVKKANVNRRIKLQKHNADGL